MISKIHWRKTEFLINKDANLLKSSTSLCITPPALYLAIVYKHTGNIRRTIFFDKDLTLLSSEHPEELGRMLPGIYQCIEKIFKLFHEAETQYICDKSIFLTSASRGSQSFAYGHFIIDILPYLFYSRLLEGFKSYTPLIYQREDWQEDLVKTCFKDAPKLGYFQDIASFYSTPYLNAYKLKAQVVHMPKHNHALFVLQQVITSQTPTNKRLSNKEGNSILFLVRKNIAGRSDRWSNADSCFEVLQKSIKERILKINPADNRPSDIAKYVRETSLTITAAGSAAYNSLLFGKSNHLTVLVVPYSIRSSVIWKLTLRMFIPFSNRLILVSTFDAPEPSSKAWDSIISLNPDDFSQAIKQLMPFSPTLSCDYPDISKRKIYSISSLTVNIPT